MILGNRNFHMNVTNMVFKLFWLGFAAKYDVAMSTSCARFNYIVGETYETAQPCIELLRNMNVGTANFMILLNCFPI